MKTILTKPQFEMLETLAGGSAIVKDSDETYNINGQRVSANTFFKFQREDLITLRKDESVEPRFLISAKGRALLADNDIQIEAEEPESAAPAPATVSAAAVVDAASPPRASTAPLPAGDYRNFTSAWAIGCYLLGALLFYWLT